MHCRHYSRHRHSAFAGAVAALLTGLAVKKIMIEVAGTRRCDQDFEQDVNSCTLSQFYLSH